MIELIRTADDPSGRAVEDSLRDLVVAHRVRVVAVGEDTGLPAGTTLPAVRDGDRVVAGDAIPGYLEELGQFVADWSRFQSDSCYIDDDGRVC